MDIGDADFESVDKYRFKIDQIPVWSGGSTAVPTDRANESSASLASFLTITIIWMTVAVVISAALEKRRYYRLPESAVVIAFGIIGGLLLRFSGATISSVIVLIPYYE